jgi:hypothetical protein
LPTTNNAEVYVLGFAATGVARQPERSFSDLVWGQMARKGHAMLTPLTILERMA